MLHPIRSSGRFAGLAFALIIFSGHAVADSYPLDQCPVSGKKLDAMGDPVIKSYDGREVRFCCAACPEKFEADQASYLQKIDAAIVQQQSPVYPQGKCIVSGEELGSMGDPLDYVYQNRLVKLCCAGCIKKLEAEPAKYLAELDARIVAEQKETYPLATCVVSGEKLGGDIGDPIEYVYANRLVRLCCKSCIKDFEKDPAKYLAILDGAKPDNKADTGKAAAGHGDHKH